MDAEQYKAITLSLAMDNACTPEQVLTLPMNNEMLACLKAAYKSINWLQSTLLQTKQCKKKVVDKTISNEANLDEQNFFTETIIMVLRNLMAKAKC